MCNPCGWRAKLQTYYRHHKIVLVSMWKWLRLTFSYHWTPELSLNEPKTNDSQLRKIQIPLSVLTWCKFSTLVFLFFFDILYVILIVLHCIVIFYIYIIPWTVFISSIKPFFWYLYIFLDEFRIRQWIAHFP